MSYPLRYGSWAFVSINKLQQNDGNRTISGFGFGFGSVPDSVGTILLGEGILVGKNIVILEIALPKYCVDLINAGLLVG